MREFVMKDAYTFDRNADEFLHQYEKMRDTYTRIFERLGLQTWVVAADNGYIGGEYCHEFCVESEIGESRFFVSEDGSYVAHEDIAAFKRELVNPDDEIRDFQIVEQPEWVETMEDNQRHYGLPRSRYLKNVVYRHTITGEIIIATIRGDLDVSKIKLERAIGAVGLLTEATDDDLARLGTRSGWVHSWGHPARYIGDLSLTTVRNFIGGQKQATTDSINVNYGRDFTCEKLADIAAPQEGYLTEDGRSRLIEKRGIEVGNIFQLGYHYTEKMRGAIFTDEDGQDKPFYMGCYGIGLARTMAAIVEKHHDDHGIRWSETIAPYRVHLISLKGGEAKAEELYHYLTDQGISVLWDDRDHISAGAKFNDADLIGIPVRLVISQKTGDHVEWKRRDSSDKELVSWDEASTRLRVST
jgi:prolyl-tRNA synthetase